MAEREDGFGLDLEGDVIATEMYCPGTSTASGLAFAHMFAPFTRIEISDDTLTFNGSSRLVQFRRTQIPAP